MLAILYYTCPVHSCRDVRILYLQMDSTFLGDDRLESVTINKSAFESILRDLLLVKHYRVEVYKNKGGKTEWNLAYKVSVSLYFFFKDSHGT